MKIGTELLGTHQAWPILIDLTLQHEQPRESGDISIDIYLPLLHDVLHRIMAEIISIQYLPPSIINQLRIPNKFEDVLDHQ